MVDRGPFGSILEYFLFRVFQLFESLFKVFKTLVSFSVYVKVVPPMYHIRKEGSFGRFHSGIWKLNVVIFTKIVWLVIHCKGVVDICYLTAAAPVTILIAVT